LGDKSSGVDALSHRQREILRLISQHLQAKEVARILNISERTVKTHTDAARRRLGVATSREAARVLVAHEAASGLVSELASGIVLDGRWPPRPIAEPPTDLPVSGHEQALYTERSVFSGAVERPGSRLADDGIPGQTEPDPRHPGSRQNAEPQWRLREGDIHGDSRDGVADRRWDKFEKRLKALSVVHWLVLIVAAAVISSILVSGLIATSMGTLESLQHISRHFG
jgi:DNA-binding CsgD family transcriptional regulator